MRDAGGKDSDVLAQTQYEAGNHRLGASKISNGSTVEETERKLEYDLYYIKNLSFKLDLAIILATFNVILFGRGAK
jgi:lipopolysaccharide/colanic/teichoic acid biosynthesis glycosyltransferase